MIDDFVLYTIMSDMCQEEDSDINFDLVQSFSNFLLDGLPKLNFLSMLSKKKKGN
jgi:hypothetical protein